MSSISKTAIEKLRQVAGFDRLDSDVLTRLAEHSRPHHLQAGQNLIHRGDPQPYLAVVCSGSLEICLFGRDGRRHVLRHLQPGELFGLIPVMDGKGAIHDADAHEPTELLEITRDSLLAEMMMQPTFALMMMEILCTRSRQLYELFAYQQLLPLGARVAHMLLCLVQAEPQLPRQNGSEFIIHLTQTEMGDMLGMSRQTINGELKKLERKRLISLAHARCVVLDLPGLERAVTLTA